MSEMKWYEAFTLLDDYIKGGLNDEVDQAWQTFLQSPFPHLNSRAAKSAEDFLATAEHYDGKGTEYLIYRLTKVVEDLPALLNIEPQPSPYLQMVVQLWELMVARGGDPLAIDIYAWSEQYPELREALLVRKRTRELKARVKEQSWLYMPVVVNGKPVDEAFQTAYCDECGAELGTDGQCQICN